MAHNREWDRGKNTWDDGGGWYDNNGRGNVRGREEDYQGEGKRRKYNNGVRQRSCTSHHAQTIYNRLFAEL